MGVQISSPNLSLGADDTEYIRLVISYQNANAAEGYLLEKLGSAKKDTFRCAVFILEDVLLKKENTPASSSLVASPIASNKQDVSRD